jgi:hypothetical protein
MSRNPGRPRRRLDRIIAFGALAILATLCGLSFSGAAVAQQGIGITVTVAPDSSGDGSAGGSQGGGSPQGGSSSGGSNVGSGDSPAGTASADASPAPSSGGSSLGGIVFVSGLGSRYLWSVNPLDTRVRLTIIVRNDSRSMFSAKSLFWIETPVGSRFGEDSAIPISRLKPGETRTIETIIGGVGQWTVLHAHVKLTPPRTVDGTTLKPVTRDSFVLVPPLLVGGSALALCIVFTALRFVWIARAVALTGGA